MTPLTLRLAYPDDTAALTRLAALDSTRLPCGPMLIAEIDGEPWAAIAVQTGITIANPFRPTAELVELLHRRRAQRALELRGTAPRRSCGAWGRAAVRQS